MQLLFFSSYNILAYQCLTTVAVLTFLCGSGFGMLLLGKTQKTHPRDRTLNPQETPGSIHQTPIND